MEKMMSKVKELAEILQLEGNVDNVNVISNGNINVTYDVTMDNNGEKSRYVFQKVNIFVFKSPKKIMSNIEKITAHISDKLMAEGKSRDYVMHFAHTADGKNYYLEELGFWRVSEYVPNTVTINSCDNLDTINKLIEFLSYSNVSISACLRISSYL